MTSIKNESGQASTGGKEVSNPNPLLLATAFNLLPQNQSNGANENTESNMQQNTQNLEDVGGSIVVGNDANNANIRHQVNHVQENRGVTGITGTGHTINIYQYPKELTELLIKLAK
jgi:hypothetical protein